MKKTELEYTLSEESCDQIAEQIAAFCNSIGMDRKDALRHRLSAEECLLVWMEQMGAGGQVTLRTGKRLLEPYIILEAEGEALNPFRTDEEQFGAYSTGILVNLHLQPEYSYDGKRNRIYFRLKRKSMGQLTKLLLVILAAALVGALGNRFLPREWTAALLDGLIIPVYDTFFRILNCIAGPMIFLSVTWGIYGIGDAATLGRVGRRLMRNDIVVVFLAAVFAALFFPLLGPGLSATSGQSSQVSAILEIILGIFPATIIEPFASGNTMQIIFLAFVIGIALLYLGKQTQYVAAAVEQVNILVNYLMDVISRIVPFVVFLVILTIIWSGDYTVVATVWKLIVAMLAAFVLAALVYLLYTSIRLRVSPLLIMKKSLPAFVVALATASSAAAFSSNMNTCKKKFGIDPALCSFGIPLGMVIHKPFLAIYNVLLVFTLATIYSVSCSISWIIVAVFIAAILAISTPPIPGGAAIAYALLLSQLNIPTDALTLVLALDILTDFIATAFEVSVLPLTLINTSARLAMIDKDVLRSE